MRHRDHDIIVFTLLTQLLRSPQWEMDLMIENILFYWEQNGEIGVNRRKTSKQGLLVLFKIETFHFLLPYSHWHCLFFVETLSDFRYDKNTIYHTCFYKSFQISEFFSHNMNIRVSYILILVL